MSWKFLLEKNIKPNCVSIILSYVVTYISMCYITKGCCWEYFSFLSRTWSVIDSEKWNFIFFQLADLFPEQLHGRREAATGSCSVKKVVLKNFTSFRGKHLWWSFFLIKLQVWPATLLKRDSVAGFCLWFLRNFSE